MPARAAVAVKLLSESVMSLPGRLVPLFAVRVRMPEPRVASKRRYVEPV